MRVKFAEQLCLFGASLVPIISAVGASGLPDAAFVCAWLLLCAVLPLIGTYTNERTCRQVFADNEATRCDCPRIQTSAQVVSRTMLNLVVALACNMVAQPQPWRNVQHEHAARLVQAMLPAHITRAMRDGVSRGCWCVPCHRHCAGAPIAATEQRVVALMATDIAGFTALSAEIGAEEVVQMLDS